MQRSVMTDVRDNGKRFTRAQLNPPPWESRQGPNVVNRVYPGGDKGVLRSQAMERVIEKGADNVAGQVCIVKRIINLRHGRISPDKNVM